MTDTLIPNVAELRRVLHKIEDYPASWYQGLYASRDSCGTAYCFAGHVVVDAGYEFFWLRPTSFSASMVIVNGLKLFPADSLAGNLLGLTDNQRDELFEANNSLEDLRRICFEITNGEIPLVREAVVEEAVGDEVGGQENQAGVEGRSLVGV